MDYPYLESQFPVLLLSRALRALEPGIITAAGDIETTTHPVYLEYPPVFRDESILHF